MADRRRGWILPVVVAVSLLAVVMVRIISDRRGSETGSVTGTPVRVEYPRLRPLEETLTAWGNVRSANQVTILPKVAGTLTAAYAEVGNEVDAGDVLARIDPQVYELDLRRAEAAFGSASSTWERVNQLYSTGNATRQSWEDARAVFTAAEAQMSAARLRYGWTAVESPVRGVVLIRHANPGALVAPEALTPLYTIGSLDDLEVEVYLPESRYPDFTGPVPAVRSQVESMKDIRPLLTIRSVAPWVDPQTRTFAVVCRIQPDGEGAGVVRPGMLLNVDFIVSVSQDVLTLPVSALTGGNHVWAVTEDGRAERRQLENPVTVAGYLPVPPTWSADRFVVEGQHFLEDGTALRIIGSEVPGADR